MTTAEWGQAARLFFNSIRRSHFHYHPNKKYSSISPSGDFEKDVLFYIPDNPRLAEQVAIFLSTATQEGEPKT